MPEQIFDLDRAEKLRPQLERWLRVAVAAKKQVAEIEREYARLVESILRWGGRRVDVPYFSRRKQEREECISRLRKAAQEIEDSGCLLKDLEVGLVDLPCKIEGRELYLCWKLGEPGIRFWHNTDEGFTGRKPVDEKFLAQLKRPRPS